MSCHACSRRTFSLFYRSFADIPSIFQPSPTAVRNAPSSHLVPSARRFQSVLAFKDSTKPFAAADTKDKAQKSDGAEKERPAWQLEKEASKKKLNGEAWKPRKKLSPDTLEGIRHLHKTQPQKFTTPVLSQHFKVSPEAIKRILKSKWRPSDEEQEARLRRWDKRGEQIWSNLVELGVKPPKRWREMGVGKSGEGEEPTWKSRPRNSVKIEDSFNEEVLGLGQEEDILPVVDGTFTPAQTRRRNKTLSLSDRIGA